MPAVVQAVGVRLRHGVEELAILADRHVVLAHLVDVGDRAVAVVPSCITVVSAALPGSPTVTNCRLVWPAGMLNTSACAEPAMSIATTTAAPDKQRARPRRRQA